MASGSSSSLAPTGSLWPVLAQQTGRYNVSKRVQPSHSIIEPGMFLSSRDIVPRYLPEQWSPHVHPEGQIYFSRSITLRVVTDSYMYTPSIAEKVTYWVSNIEKRAADRGFVLSDTVELYIQIDDEDCNYYLADHATHTIFWLDEYETSELGLLPVVSSSHLKLALEEQYWSHVENHSMHFGGLPTKSINDLILVFSHAIGDHMTSPSSTFPYDVDECQKFLTLLNNSRAHIHEGHITTVVARLWSMITMSRFYTHHGEEQARLSRDTPILVDNDNEIRWTERVISLVTFKSSTTYLKSLNQIWTDHFVYAMDWNPFMARCIRGWQTTFQSALSILLLHVLLLFFPVLPELLVISAALLFASMVTSVLLVYRHEGLETGGAPVAHAYLTGVCSKRFKFQLVALAFSLPNTFYLLGLITFFLHGIVLINGALSSNLSIACLAVVVVLVVAFQCATSQSRLPRLRFSQLYPRFLKSKAQESDSIV